MAVMSLHKSLQNGKRTTPYPSHLALIPSTCLLYPLNLPQIPRHHNSHILLHFFTSSNRSEQSTLSKQVLQSNHLTFSPNPPFNGLNHIAGVDISFLKNTDRAC